MMKNIFTMAVLALFITCCKSGDTSFQQIKDKDITVQMDRLENGTEVNGTASFKVRIIPAAQLADRQNLMKNKLMYDMDSCFYLLSGKQKVYPVIAQAIGNGVKNTFEYLVTFDQVNLAAGDIKLVYYDSYLTHKTYPFKSIKSQN